MKKFLLPLMAVLVAIGLSAFTAPQKVHARTHLVNLNWYSVVFNQDHPDGYIPASATPDFTNMSKSEVDPIDGCSGTGRDCLRGFSGTPSLPTEDRGVDQTEQL
jgi:hypothetical protein